MKSVKQLWFAVPAAITMMVALPGAMAAVHVAASGDTATQPGSGSATQPGSGAPSDANKMKKPTDGGSPTDGASSGAMVDDSTITAKVKSALVADSELKSAHNISVKTKKGEVVLSGKVDSQDQIDKAVQVASNVEGVKSVSNKLSVKKSSSSPSQPPSSQPSDQTQPR